MKPFTASAAHRLRSAYLRMHRVTNRAFRPLNMTADQYVLLRLLCEADGVSQQQLSAQSASDPTTVGRMLDLLERKKLVRREPLATDRRTRLVYLTAQGRKMAEQLYAIAEPIREQIAAAISDAELTAVLDALHRLSDTFSDASPTGSNPAATPSDHSTRRTAAVS